MDVSETTNDPPTELTKHSSGMIVQTFHTTSHHGYDTLTVISKSQLLLLMAMSRLGEDEIKS